ncbi:PREDICTED: myrosinase 1 isoform X2 [Rhagoletis zephyria]|uniref:myrosinase 1 isoform X2 n=1 Tax=Rhagoletis zephyria TaxID=28612 RepID=UPI0008113756|nr:PREDICTED: myrosinase 1 isoform X2 [Rhagoletis zephyria]
MEKTHLQLLTFLCIFTLSFCVPTPTPADIKGRNFPPDFIWGIGTSAYQIEGGWNASDKGESIWDHLTHRFPEKIDDQSNGDISSDSYHQWRRDVQMIRDLNVHVYRFSISWTRIMPGGYMNQVSSDGIRHYSDLINELLHYNITPMVTIYHWDLPQRLQELGGWTNPEIIPVFKDYARLLFEMYGDRIKIWTTINEPWHICEFGYGVDYMAPSYNYPGIPSYLCAHNLLKAHAEVVHMYREKYQDLQKGKIGLTMDTSWMEPKTDSVDDQEASERALQFYLGWYAHPIFSKRGNYPQVMIDRIHNLSKEQGFTRSRLPEFTADEVRRIRGTADFFGINSYTSKRVTKNDHNNSNNFPIPSFNHDMGVIEDQDPNWTGSGSAWLKVVPKGMYNLLMWIMKEYNNPPIIVTENGVSDVGGLADYKRVDYINSYLSVKNSVSIMWISIIPIVRAHQRSPPEFMRKFARPTQSIGVIDQVWMRVK